MKKRQDNAEEIAAWSSFCWNDETWFLFLNSYLLSRARCSKLNSKAGSSGLRRVDARAPRSGSKIEHSTNAVAEEIVGKKEAPHTHRNVRIFAYARVHESTVSQAGLYASVFILCASISYSLKRHLENLAGSRPATNRVAALVLCPYMARAVDPAVGRSSRRVHYVRRQVPRPAQLKDIEIFWKSYQNFCSTTIITFFRLFSNTFPMKCIFSAKTKNLQNLRATRRCPAPLRRTSPNRTASPANSLTSLATRGVALSLSASEFVSRLFAATAFGRLFPCKFKGK